MRCESRYIDGSRPTKYPRVLDQKSLCFDHFLLFWWRFGGFACFRCHWIAPRLACARNSRMSKEDGGAFERATPNCMCASMRFRVFWHGSRIRKKRLSSVDKILFFRLRLQETPQELVSTGSNDGIPSASPRPSLLSARVNRKRPRSHRVSCRSILFDPASSEDYKK